MDPTLALFAPPETPSAQTTEPSEQIQRARAALVAPVETPPSPQTPPQRAAPEVGTRQVISPAQDQYLRRQASSILAGGGSEADVLEFLRLEGHKTPPTFEASPDAVRLPGMAEGLSMRALNGITFGFGDEALGGLLGILSGEGARGGIESYRAEMDAWAREGDGRKAGWVAEIAGAALSGSAALKGAKAGATALGRGGQAVARRAFGQRTAALVGQGAAGGGASAAGNSEGDLSDRAKSALFGAVIGGATAGVLSGAGRFLGVGTKPIARSLTPKGVQNAIPGLGSSERHAEELLIEALQKDGLDVGMLRSNFNMMSRTGAPVTLADLGGDSVMELASEALTLRSPNKQKLVEMFLGRQAEQGQRLTEELFSTISRGSKFGLRNSYDALDDLALAQKAAAAPLYEEAFQHTVSLSDRAKFILKRPQFREAWDAGRLIADNEAAAGIGHGLEIPPLPTGSLRASAREALEGMGVGEEAIQRQLAQIPDDFPSDLPVRGLDYMKRGLDQVIKKGLKEGAPWAETRNLQSIRTMLNEVLDEANDAPGYGAARTVWGGFQRATDNLNLGRDFLKKPPEIVQRELASLNPFERDAYRLGAAQSIYEAVQKGSASETSDIARRFFGGRLLAEEGVDGRRIRALFPDNTEGADAFMRRVAAEARISHTTQRAVPRAGGRNIQNFEETVEGAIPTVRATGGVMLANIVRSGIVRSRTGFTEEVSDDIATLFSKGISDPGSLNHLFDRLEAAELRLAMRNRLGSVGAIATGAMAGTVN